MIEAQVGDIVEVESYDDVYYLGHQMLVRAVIDEGVFGFIEADEGRVYSHPCFLDHGDYKVINTLVERMMQ